MAEDIGLIIGITIMLVFGAVVTFIIPRAIQKYDGDPERAADGRTMVAWMRWLGAAVMVIGVVFLVFYLFFKAPEF